MSEKEAAAWRSRSDSVRTASARSPWHLLRLALGAVWLLDAELQSQGFMFTRAFGRTLAATAQGNPSVVADPINWSAGIIEAHPGPVNVAFAAVQLLLGLGIIWRPTVRIALAASVVWSVAVWWLGEGLGGVLSGTASPLNGAPGAVILYALFAVLLWPCPEGKVPFEAARAVGPRVARLLWALLWGSLAWFALSGPVRDLPGMISGMASGEPGWLAAINDGTAGLLARDALPVSVTLAVVFAGVAVGIYAPARVARAAVIIAITAAAVIWVAGEGLGGVFTGSATDLNSGPLLILIAAAYWPQPATRGQPVTQGLTATRGLPAIQGPPTADRRARYSLDSAVMHVVMAVVMAGMLAPWLGIVRQPAWGRVWLVVFAAGAAWFGARAVRLRRNQGSGGRRCAYPVPHLAECVAMMYMLAAAGTPAAGIPATGTPAAGTTPATGAAMAGVVMGSPSTARAPELAVVFALFMVGYVAWLGDRFPSAVPSRAACCCKIAMAIVMGYALIVML